MTKITPHVPQSFKTGMNKIGQAFGKLFGRKIKGSSPAGNTGPAGTSNKGANFQPDSPGVGKTTDLKLRKSTVTKPGTMTDSDKPELESAKTSPSKPKLAEGLRSSQTVETPEKPRTQAPGKPKQPTPPSRPPLQGPKPQPALGSTPTAAPPPLPPRVRPLAPPLRPAKPKPVSPVPQQQPEAPKAEQPSVPPHKTHADEVEEKIGNPDERIKKFAGLLNPALLEELESQKQAEQAPAMQQPTPPVQPPKPSVVQPQPPAQASLESSPEQRAQNLQDVLMQKAKELQTMSSYLGRKLKPNQELQKIAALITDPISHDSIVNTLKAINRSTEDLEKNAKTLDKDTLLKLFKFMTEPAVRHVMYTVREVAPEYYAAELKGSKPKDEEKAQRYEQIKKLHEQMTKLFLGVNLELGFPSPRSVSKSIALSTKSVLNLEDKEIEGNEAAFSALKERDPSKPGTQGEEGFQLTLLPHTDKAREQATEILKEVYPLNPPQKPPDA